MERSKPLTMSVALTLKERNLVVLALNHLYRPDLNPLQAKIAATDAGALAAKIEGGRQ